MNEKVKLREARYFLGRMRACEKEPEAFRCELSAFLAASRTVLQYALREVKSKSGGRAWYDTSMANAKTLGFFKDKRDISIHQQPVVPSTDATVALTDAVTIADSLSITLRGSHGQIVDQRVSAVERSAPQKEVRLPIVTYLHTFADWSGPEDLLDLSAAYLAELEVLVSDGIARGLISG